MAMMFIIRLMASTPSWRRVMIATPGHDDYINRAVIRNGHTHGTIGYDDVHMGG